MTDWNLPWEGGCRCDRVRIRVSAPPVFTAACHCTGCQKMSSSAFSLTVAVPPEGFAVIAGETVIGGMHGDLQHHFCAWCMSWMFTRADMMPFVNVRPTMLDKSQWFVPFIETMTSEKLAWATTPAVQSYERFPPMEDFAALVGAFNAWAPGAA